MSEALENAVAGLRATVAALERDRISVRDAHRLVDLFSEAERLCQAGRALAAKRVLETRSWRAHGYRTPAQWMAARTQRPLGQAITTVETVHRLADLPATREAFAAGRLSETQAAEITAAAGADPGSERELLELAGRESASALRERCREVRASAAGDEAAAERLRRRRYLRHWTDPTGAVRLDALLPPDDGARVVAVVTARTARLQARARRAGQREAAEAHAADALVELADGAPAGATPVVHVHVDSAALERGHTLPGETCRIEGIGPVPVSTARRLATAGILKALASDGADIRAVAHLGRSIPARLRTALEARDPVCVVPGCEVRHGLEIDHILPLARGGATALGNLARLCRYHHALKTHRGWRLNGRPGAWTWTRGGRTGEAPGHPGESAGRATELAEHARAP